MFVAFLYSLSIISICRILIANGSAVVSHPLVAMSRRGVGDKPMPCKPGIAGSIPGFSKKTTFGELLGVPVIKTTHKS